MTTYIFNHNRSAADLLWTKILKAYRVGNMTSIVRFVRHEYNAKLVKKDGFYNRLEFKNDADFTWFLLKL